MPGIYDLVQSINSLIDEVSNADNQETNLQATSSSQVTQPQIAQFTGAIQSQAAQLEQMRHEILTSNQQNEQSLRAQIQQAQIAIQEQSGKFHEDQLDASVRIGNELSNRNEGFYSQIEDRINEVGAVLHTRLDRLDGELKGLYTLCHSFKSSTSSGSSTTTSSAATTPKLNVSLNMPEGQVIHLAELDTDIDITGASSAVT